jgi:hypothetical protein
MKKIILLIVVALTATSVAMAQSIPVPTPTWGNDELGAHNGYGRGCVMCHATHGGVAGNNGTASSTSSTTALWGQNLSPYYGKTFYFGTSSYGVTLPANGTSVSISDTNSIVLLCLSCHDGSLSRVAMMQGVTVETLPIVGGNAPTLFGVNSGNTGLNFYNEHPVGPSAVVSCGGGYNWDCTGGGNTLQPINMNGAASGAFLTNNPSSFWNAATYTACGGAGQPACSWGSNPATGYNISHNPLSTPTGGTTVNAVTCTTCHNQHSMTVWSVTKNGVTTPYSTMFFIKGYYNPASGGNNVSQFCRNCHGGNSNEMVGTTGSVPTT